MNTILKIRLICCFILGSSSLVLAQGRAIVINLNTNDTVFLEPNAQLFFGLKGKPGFVQGRLNGCSETEIKVNETAYLAEELSWIDTRKPYTRKKDRNEFYKYLLLAGGAALSTGAYEYQVIEDRKTGIIAGSTGAALMLAGGGGLLFQKKPQFDFEKKHLLKLISK